MTPAKLNGEQKTIKLPGPFSHVVVGGNGRYLIFYLKQLKQLAIFDVSAAKVIKQLPVVFEEISFTAGADKLVILSRDQKIIQRYSLETFEKELSREIPVEGDEPQIAMGSASNGPILLSFAKGNRKENALLDLQTLEKSLISATDKWNLFLGGGHIVHAAPDGRLFGICRINSEPTGVSIIAIKDDSADAFQRRKSVGLVVPNADGSLLYTASGVYTQSLRQVTEGGCLDTGIPAVYSDFHFVRGADGAAFNLHLAGQARPLATVPAPGPPKVPPVKTSERRSEVIRPGTDPFLRYYFIQQAQVLICLPESNEEVILQHLDLMQTLEKSDKSFLFVTGKPVLEATRGKRYTDSIQVKSNRGNVAFQLFSGPAGMTISSTGVIQWDVPSSFESNQTDVIVSVRDASGYELMQHYQLAITGTLTKAETSPRTAKTPGPMKPALRSAPAVAQVQKPAVNKVMPAGKDSQPQSRVVNQKSAGDLIQGQKQISLPAPLTEMVVGGSGKYLIMYFKSLKRLEVFDVSQLAFIKSLPVESDDILFAAGAEYLVVVLPDQKKLERWKLSNFTRDRVIPVPVENPVNAVVMGHAAVNSLVLFSAHSPHFSSQNYTYVDLRTLKVIEVNGEVNQYFDSYPLHLKTASSSADGRIVTVGDIFLVFKDSIVNRRTSQRGYASLILAGADGNYLYTERGIITNQMKLVYQNSRVGKPVPAIQIGYPIPAIQPGYFLNLLSPDHRKPNQFHKLAVHAEGQIQPLLVLDKIDTSLCQIVQEKPPGMAFAKRYSFFPHDKVLIQIPNTNDRLVIHQVDIEELLKQSGIDYFYVTSHPETDLFPGQEWEYQLKVNSKRGGVQYRLQSSPEGMLISDTGLVTWKVPSDIVESEVAVTVSLKDGSAQELSHRFTLLIPAAIQNAQKAVQLAQNKVREEQERKAAEAKMAAARQAAEREAALKAARDERNRMKLQRLNEHGESARKQAETYAAQRLTAFEQQQASRRFQSVQYPLRFWTDMSGNEIEARFIENFADTVILASSNKQIYTIPVSSFSDVDRTYLNQISEAELTERKQREADAANPSLPIQRMRQIFVAIQEDPRRFMRALNSGGIRQGSQKSLLSWRVQILDRTGEDDLYHLFRHDEPWDSEYNKKLIPLMPAFYRSPQSKAGEGKTNLLAIRRPQPPLTGLRRLAMLREKRLSNNSQAALLVEVPDALAVEWTRPDDWEYESEASIKQLFGIHSNGFYTLFGNGKIELIPSMKSLKEISTLLNLEGKPTAESK